MALIETASIERRRRRRRRRTRRRRRRRKIGLRPRIRRV
jgi:hypothetical protein